MYDRDDGACIAQPNGLVTGLFAFFAIMYFVQGFGDPTSGLIAQPVRSLLRTWGESPAAIAGFMALLALPWSFKPLFGLLSDYLPFFGSRRRSYLLLATASAALGLLILWLVPLPPGSRTTLMLLLMIPTIGIAFGDVLMDALMIERGQPLGITGQLQSTQWAATYIALLLTGVTAGYLAQHGLQQAAFGIAAAMWVAALALAWFYAREGPIVTAPPPRKAWRLALATPGLLPLVGLQFLWSMNPLWVSVLYLHLTDGMGLSEQEYGIGYSLFSAGCVAASIGYGFYCRRIAMGRLLHLSVVLGLLANVVYWVPGDRLQLFIVSVVAGAAYMSGMLIQLDAAARMIPLALAATLFASIMALTNLAASLSEAMGGLVYQWLQPYIGELDAFRLVVLLSMAFAASSWILFPALRRSVPRWWPLDDGRLH